MAKVDTLDQLKRVARTKLNVEDEGVNPEMKIFNKDGGEVEDEDLVLLKYVLCNLFTIYSSFNVAFKGDLQSDLRMCTKEPTFYDTNSLTMFWVLAKPDCCFLIIYYTLEA
jgi:hypothetical protein